MWATSTRACSVAKSENPRLEREGSKQRVGQYMKVLELAVAIIEQRDELMWKPLQLVASYVELYQVLESMPGDWEAGETIVAEAKDLEVLEVDEGGGYCL